jgi:hypothetical protein
MSITDLLLALRRSVRGCVWIRAGRPVGLALGRWRAEPAEILRNRAVAGPAARSGPRRGRAPGSRCFYFASKEQSGQSLAARPNGRAPLARFEQAPDRAELLVPRQWWWKAGRPVVRVSARRALRRRGRGAPRPCARSVSSRAISLSEDPVAARSATRRSVAVRSRVGLGRRASPRSSSRRGCSAQPPEPSCSNAVVAMSSELRVAPDCFTRRCARPRLSSVRARSKGRPSRS